MTLNIGEMLNNRYRIVKLLGQGGFGAVYKAWDINLNRQCALKENFETSEDAQRQFFREASTLANLSHSNLPRVTDYFAIPDQGQYLVMDFVDGQDLNTYVETNGAVPPQQAIEWITQVMDALIYLHSRKPPVIHRDIKPANIRITPDGQAVLVDFGLVKLYQANLKTTVGARAITPGYSPPEQYGQGSTDERTDLYALGATLYMLLTGAHPPESVQRVAADTLRPAHVVNPQVPAHIGEAVQRAMGLTPTTRYPTVAEFKSALTNQAPPPPRYVQPTPVTMDARASAPNAVSPEPLPAPVSQPRKKKFPVWAIILIVLGGLGGITLACLGGLYFIGDSSLSQTKTADAMNTQQAFLDRTSTAVMAQQMTATAEANAIATAQAEAALLTNLRASGVKVYGPGSGSLVHEDDGLIEVAKSEVNLRDFLAEATFMNPYSTSEGGFDVGFLFRHEDGNYQYRLIIGSDREWDLLNNTGESDGEKIAKGVISNFDNTEFGINTITLVAQGEIGGLYVNDVLVDNFDLSARMNAGDVQIASGMYTGNEIPGKSTEYFDFSVWSLE